MPGTPSRSNIHGILALAVLALLAGPAAAATTAIPDSFEVEVQSYGRGTVVPQGIVRVSRGADLAIDFTPEGCATLFALEVDGAAVTPVAHWVFTNVQADHFVFATFAPPTVEVVLNAYPAQGSCAMPVMLLARVESGAGGTVEFFSTGTPLGTAPLIANLARLVVPATMIPGAHAFSARYAGSECAQPGESPELPYMIGVADSGAFVLELVTTTRFADIGERTTGVVAARAPDGSVVPDIRATIEIYADDTLRTTCRMSDGVAHWSLMLAKGEHRLQAVLVADDCLPTLRSNIVDFPVFSQHAIENTITEFTFSPAHPRAGELVTFTAWMTPSDAPGAVRFENSVTGHIVAEGTLKNGVTTASFVPPSPASYYVQAFYVPSANHLGSTSFGRWMEVAAGAESSTVALEVAPVDGTDGKGFVLVAHVEPPGCGGVVQFDGVFGTSHRFAVHDGVARCPTRLTVSGRHIARARYSGDGTHAPSVATPVEVVIDSLTLAPVLYASGNPLRVGENVQIAATLAPGDTGTVVFEVDGMFGQPVPVVDGIARWSTGWSVPGLHALRARHSAHPTLASNTVTLAVRDSAAPRMNIVSPTDGGMLCVGTPARIKWAGDYGLSSRYVWLYVSRSPSNDFEPLAEQVPDPRTIDPSLAAGYFDWVPAGPAPDAWAPSVVRSGRLLVLDPEYGLPAGMSVDPLRYTQLGGLGIEGAPRAIVVSAPEPNPSRGAVSLRIDLVEPGPVELAVVDIAGRVQWRSPPRTFAAGSHSLHWNGLTSRGAAPPGVYFVRCVTPTRTLQRRFVVVR